MLWHRIRGRLAGRSDSEHEQVLIRVAIATASLIYLSVTAQGTSHLALAAARCVPWTIAYVLGAVLLLGHLLHAPATNPTRRWCGLCLDMVTITAVLGLGASAGALFFPFYLWITLGMGFRYGQRYLLTSAAMSALSFATVMLLSAHWRSQPILALGLGVALLAIPLYAKSLLAKLTDALDRAQEASRAKSRFLASMSHELRTPLHAVMGMAELLAREPLTAEQHGMVRTTHDAGQTLLELIDDVLEVARLETGSAPAPVVDFDLHALLAEIHQLLSHQALAKGLQLELQLDAAVPHELTGAARWLKQILINLIANAVKFTEAGRVTVRIGASHCTPEQVILECQVTDTGVGVPEAARERIFEQFTQIDQSASRRYGGTGLGLAIARQLATLMAGRLWLEPTSAAGARFCLSVPMARRPVAEPRLAGHLLLTGEPPASTALAARLEALGLRISLVDRPASEAGPVAARLAWTPAPDGDGALGAAALLRLSALRPGRPAEAELMAPASLADDLLGRALQAVLAMAPAVASHAPVRRPAALGRKILVAEDNRTNQKVVERMLQAGGHRVTIVEDGEAMLDLLAEQAFDLVLVDLNMPNLSGLDAVKLHRFAGPGDDPPFVALTADITPETRQHCADAGIDAYLSKPVDLQELLSLIDRLTAAASPPAPRASSGVVVPHPRLGAFRPPLDRSYLARLQDLDDTGGFVLDLIQDFIQDAELLLDELAKSIEAGDAAQFRDRAHALRSSAVQLGGTALAEVCAARRAIGPAELRAEGPAIESELRAEFARLRAALLSAVREPGDQLAAGRPD